MCSVTAQLTRVPNLRPCCSRSLGTFFALLHLPSAPVDAACGGYVVYPALMVAFPLLMKLVRFSGKEEEPFMDACALCVRQAQGVIVWGWRSSHSQLVALSAQSILSLTQSLKPNVLHHPCGFKVKVPFFRVHFFGVKRMHVKGGS